MQRRRLGATGPEVSAIGLGCMSFGGIFGPTDEEASQRCLDAAIDGGIDFLDVANIYGMGVCESVIGRFLKRRKPKVVIATKASIMNGPPRRFDNSEAHLRSELEGSLKRLGVDYVDLFYIHRREVERPIEEVVGTLKKLIDQGKIGGYGLSEVSPGTLRRAHAVHPCMAVQNEYSLWTRQPELGLIQTCAELGVAFVPFSPLARGVFGAPAIDANTLPEKDFRRSIPRFQEPDWSLNMARIAPFRAFCAEHGWTVPAAALAWVLDQGDHLIPIPGTRTAENLGAWVGASEIRFTDADRAEIARLLPVGFAHGDRYNLDQAITVERYC
ncbi:MAG: aldo/keto reductase [Cereibacter sphaeroides]|uniref:Aldo/keto reductase n=1 Tax=Cereibacter sphaeroides TaxID=1063 RepID=A0A2W5UFG3_CERSP|nr:MAG: aldo/keto reductase [Cereibacter sphaeroides]